MKFLQFYKNKIDGKTYLAQNIRKYIRNVYIVFTLALKNNVSDEMKKIISLCAVSSVAVTRVIFHDYELQGRYPLSRFKSAEIVTLVFFVPEFFPKLERVIYLDSDMLVTGDINTVFGPLDGDSGIEEMPEEFRTHGGSDEGNVPMIIYNHEVNFDAWHDYQYNFDLTRSIGF